MPKKQEPRIAKSKCFCTNVVEAKPSREQRKANTKPVTVKKERERERERKELMFLILRHANKVMDRRKWRFEKKSVVQQGMSKTQSNTSAEVTCFHRRHPLPRRCCGKRQHQRPHRRTDHNWVVQREPSAGERAWALLFRWCRGAVS